MKILFIIDSLPRGGKERRMIELIKDLLKKRSYELEVVILSEKVEYEEIHNLGIEVHNIKRKFKWDPSILIRVFSICSRFKPNIIHSWGSMASIYSIPSVKLLGAKLIHGSIANAPHKKSTNRKKLLHTKFSFPFADVVLGNSYRGLEAYGAPDNKSICIHNGFDFRRIENLKDPNTVRKEYGLENKKVLGMVGAFHDRKDYNTFIKATTKLMDQRKDLIILCIGDGPNLNRTIASVPVKYKEDIIFTGLVKNVESLIQLFEIGILITNDHVHGEGISNAIMEYMALGKPVVATDGGGTPEIVLNGQTGFLTKPNNADDVADKISYLLDNPLIAAQMGIRGKEHVRNNFSLEGMTDKYVELYAGLHSAKQMEKAEVY
jgi:glycosyltransferase involved in cell wall biosynthesis